DAELQQLRALQAEMALQRGGETVAHFPTALDERLALQRYVPKTGALHLDPLTHEPHRLHQLLELRVGLLGVTHLAEQRLHVLHQDAPRLHLVRIRTDFHDLLPSGLDVQESNRQNAGGRIRYGIHRGAAITARFSRRGWEIYGGGQLSTVIMDPLA